MCSLEPLHPELPGTLPALFNIAEVYFAVQPTVLPDGVILEPIQPKSIKTLCLVNQSTSRNGGTFWNTTSSILPD